MVAVYTLSCPSTNDIKYVGITSKSLKERLTQHLWTPTNIFNALWFSQLKKENKIPKIEVIEYVEDSLAFETEKYWISQMKSWGFTLNNCTDGSQQRVKYIYKIREEFETFRTSIPYYTAMLLKKKAKLESRSVSNLIRLAVEKYLNNKN